MVKMVHFMLCISYHNFFKKRKGTWDIPGGAVDKNPPASAGDAGSIPDPERSHMLRNSEARGPQLLSLHA